MDIRQLKYFLAIAEEGSISRAAERLHMAQPPLSQQLRLLEDELGVTLFERNTRKIRLTDIGEMLQHRAKQIMELLETTIKEVKDISAGFQGTLTIGTVSSAGATLLPVRLRDFAERFPGVNFDVIDEDTNRIIELLNSGVIEIGIIRTPFNAEPFESIYLPEEPLVVVGLDMSCWKEQKSISLAELSNKPLIVQHRQEKRIVELCHQAGFAPRILCRSNDVRTVLLWASTGLGLAIVPRNCTGLIQNPRLEYREINEPSLAIGTAIIWMKERYLSSVARNFLDTFKS